MPNLDVVKLTTEGKRVTSTSADGSADVIYTVPANHSAIIKFLHLSNGTTSSKKAYIQFYHADDTSYYYIVNGLSMAGHSVHDVVSGNDLALHAGDKIVGFIETGMTLDVVVSVQEYYDPNK